MTIEQLKRALLQKSEFTIPGVQKELGLGYSQVRQCVQQLVTEGSVVACDGLTYRVGKGASAPESIAKENLGVWQEFEQRERIGTESTSVHIEKRPPHTVEWDPWHTKPVDEGVELMDESFAQQSSLRFAKPYSKRAEDDGDLLEKRLCHFVEGVDYGRSLQNARNIAKALAAWRVKVEPRAIRFGIDITCYVFENLGIPADLDGIDRFRVEIQACLPAERVEKVWQKDGFLGVIAYGKEQWDPLTKRVLLFWLTQGTTATIASLCRGLGLDYSRAERVFGALLRAHFIQKAEPDAAGLQPTRPVLSLEDVEVLFPAELDWED